jgi:hypothetical protein
MRGWDYMATGVRKADFGDVNLKDLLGGQVPVFGIYYGRV